MKRLAIVAMLTFAALTANAATKVFIQVVNTNYPTNQYTFIDFYDTSTMSFISNKLVFLPKDNSILTSNDMIAYVKAAAYTEAGVKGYTITDADIITSFPLTGFPAPSSFTYPTRTLNSAFQISSTRNSRVSYTISVAATLSLSGGQTGTVVLEYADDSGITTNVVTVQSSVNGNTGTLTIGLNTIQTGSASLSGDIPAGKYVRIRTVNTAGTPTFTFSSAQEVLYN